MSNFNKQPRGGSGGVRSTTKAERRAPRWDERIFTICWKEMHNKLSLANKSYKYMYIQI
jgi:hypothetical protein